MTKIRYEIDPHNRLVIESSREKGILSRFRRVIDGRFRIGKGNILIFHIKAPSKNMAGRLYLPHQLKFKGKWSLTKDYDLKLTLNKWRRQAVGDELTLKGNIIKIGAYSLVFAITQGTKQGGSSSYILKFQGVWQADKNNRITFRVKKEIAKSDILVFDGIWEVNRKQKIIYGYTSRSKRHALTFDGFWNFTKKGILTYRLGIKEKSVFDFRVGRGIVKDGQIKFEAGIGLSKRKRPVKKNIILYGNWRIKKGALLIFEMKYTSGRAREMKFTADIRLTRTSRMKLALKDEMGKSLGLTFMLSRAMLKGSGESFIRFLRNSKERAAYVGAGFIW